jgi:hypothetical protein
MKRIFFYNLELSFLKTHLHSFPSISLNSISCFSLKSSGIAWRKQNPILITLSTKHSCPCFENKSAICDTISNTGTFFIHDQLTLHLLLFNATNDIVKTFWYGFDFIECLNFILVETFTQESLHVDVAFIAKLYGIFVVALSNEMFASRVGK